jgi:hypothetical protein
MPPIKSTIVVQHGTLQIFNIFLPHLFTGDWIVTPASQSPTPQIYGDCIKSCGFVSNGPQNTFVSLDMTDRKGHLVHTFPRPRCPTSCMYLVRMYICQLAPTNPSIHPSGYFPTLSIWTALCVLCCTCLPHHTKILFTQLLKLFSLLFHQYPIHADPIPLL